MPDQVRKSVRKASSRRRFTRIVALLSVMAIFAVIFPATSTQAAGEDSSFDIAKVVRGAGGSVPTYEPGDTFYYDLTLSCTVITPGTAGCIDAVLTDPVPAPLEVIGTPTVSAPGSTVSVDPQTNTVQVQFNVPLDDGLGNRGLPTGQSETVSFQVRVPTNLLASDAGIKHNVATIEGENSITATNAADVNIDVPLNLASTIGKSADSHTSAGVPVPAVPGQPVDFTLNAANTSNSAVDTLVVTDPATSGTDSFEYLEITGIDTLTAPQGADRVRFDWVDQDGIWHSGTTQTIPTNPNDLLSGINLADIHGVRFTFSTNGGQVPITGSGQNAVIDLTTQTRSNVTTLPDNTTITVNNTASSHVTLAETSSTPVTDNANVQIRREKPSVTITKNFEVASLPAGESTKVELRATIGPLPVTELTITEPGPGDSNFADQGLTFDGFIADGTSNSFEWPEGATGLSVQYQYAGGYTEGPRTSITIDSAPAHQAGETVTGFTLTFTGDYIPSGAYAVVPFEVTAQPVTGPDPVTERNTTEAIVESIDGQVSDPATSHDDLTRQPLRINPLITKNIVRAEIPASPGATSLVSIAGGLDPASTTGTTSLVIQDPAAPAAIPSEFYNVFDITAIPLVSVPVGSTLTVRYWDGAAWQVFDGAQDIAGGSSWSHTLTSAERSAAQGIQFEFNPVAPATELSPGFQSAPYFSVSARDQWRDGTGGANDLTVDTVIENEASTTVSNPNAIDPILTATDEDEITLIVYPGGSGPDLVDKTWLDPTTGSPTNDPMVQALTDEQRTARLLWSTGDLTWDTVTVSDPATNPATLTDSVYDAFDLVSISPITPAQDPGIAFDQVTQVERFNATLGDWEDVTSSVCSPASLCDGQFPGWTVPENERDITLGVRLTFAESPTRASRITGPTDPSVGSGVAHTDTRRPINLVFQLRNTLRSDATVPVLGTLHDNAYNTGIDGMVRNTVRAEGVRDAQTHTTTDQADITILDTPITVELTKIFDEYQTVEGVTRLPVPQAGTSPDRFPLLGYALVATNTSVSKLDSLTITDPNPATLPSDFFDQFNLQRIGVITAPAGATNTIIRLSYASGAPDTTHTISQAQALDEFALSNVISIEVEFSGRIESGAQGTVNLVSRLRVTERDSGDPVTVGQATNHAIAFGASPGGTPFDQNTAIADDLVALADPTYGVNLTKTVNPTWTNENNTTQVYTVNLQARPNGTVRTRELVIEDATPTFFNAYAFNGFNQITLPQPLRPAEVQVQVLSGVTYSMSGSDLVAQCAGNSDLSPCWTAGNWQATNANGQVTPSLAGTGIAAADVQGVRLVVRKNSTLPNWERPQNPQIPFTFTVTRRTNLVYGIAGTTDTPVPSTLTTLSPAPGESQRGIATNTATTLATGGWLAPSTDVWTATDADTKTVEKRHLTNTIAVTKTPTDTFGVADEIPFEITIRNTGTWTMAGLELTDQIQTDGNGSMLVEAPREVDDTDPIYTFTWLSGGVEQSTTGMSAALDETTGELAINLPAGFEFAPNDELRIGAKLMFRYDLDPLTSVENNINASNDRIFDRCVGQNHGTTLPNQDNVFDCAATAQVTSNPGAPIRVAKSVKGTGAGVITADPGDANYDDLGVIAQGAVPASYCSDATNGNAGGGFFRTPCLPITRAGGTTTWRVQFTNSGNVPAGVISAIDVLPGDGDTAILNSSVRGSRWTPTLIGNFTASVPGLDPSNVRIYYMNTVPSTACNRADIQNDTAVDNLPTADPCYANVNARDWQLLDESTMSAAELADVRALKFVVAFPGADAGAGLAPGQSATFTWDMRNPATADRAADSDTEPLAWNSVAAGSRGLFNGDEFRVNAIEPRAVGIALAMGKIDLSKVVATPVGWPASAPLPSSYPFELACVSAGEDIDIVDNAASPADRSAVSLPADGSVVHVGDGSATAWGRVTLPLYADCTITEDPAAQGATVTYDPAALDGSPEPITALNDQSARTDIANPALPTAIDIQSITATNSYSTGGFVVSKAVDNGGAVDQDNSPIAYNQTVSFTASCVFGGAEILGSADRSFTLTPGASRTITDVPVGSDCVVTESDNANAASTTIVLTQDGTAAAPSTATSTSFEILPDTSGGNPSITAAFTNHYTVGSVEITKVVAGAGADTWGAGPFEVQMVCTSTSTVNSTVFSATRELVPDDDLVWQVDNLPTGASCVVTEPGTGGANSTNITPSSITVGSTPVTPPAVTVTNTFITGTVAVEKVITGGGDSQYGAGPFTVTLACVRDVDGTSVNVPIPGGAVRQLTTDPVSLETVYTNLPVGAECTLTESIPGGASASAIEVAVLGGAPTVTQGTVATFTVAADAVQGDSDDPAIIATMTNTFNVGSLEISKTRTGAGAATYGSGPFTAQAVCTWVKDGTELPVTLANDGIVELNAANNYEAAISGIIVGATCHVTETAAGGAHETTYAPADSTDTTRSAAVTITATGGQALQASVTITNRFDTGSLAVTKTRTGAGAAVFGVGPFTAEVSCTYVKDGQTESVTLPSGGEIELNEANSYTVTLTGIIAGAQCHVTETDPGFATDTTYTPAHASDDSRSAGVTVVATAAEGSNGPVSLGITNEFNIQGFVVTKEIDNGGAIDADGDAIGYVQSYDFTASCVYGTTELLNSSDQSFTLTSTAPGHSKAFDELPIGTICTVTEVDAADSSSTSVTVQHGTQTPGTPAATDAATFTIGSSSVLTTFTNAYTTGAVEVTKAVTGAGAALWGGGAFEVEMVCTSTITDPGTVYSATHTVSADDPTWLVTNLPTGADCVITEPLTGGANSTEISSGSESSDTALTVTVGDTTGTAAAVAVDVTNQFDVGSLEVTKVVDGPGADVFGTGPFEVELVCTYDVDGTDVAIEIPGEAVRVLDGSNNLSTTYEQLPVGADCTLRETLTGGANSTEITIADGDGSNDEVTAGLSADVTITDDSGQQVGRVATVTNTFGSGALLIEKKRTGPGVELFGAGPFTAQAVCTWDRDGNTETVVLPDDGVVTLSAANDYQVTLTGILPGAICEVTETDAGLAVATTYTPSDGTVTVTEDTASPVTVTITNDFQIGQLTIQKKAEKKRVAAEENVTYTITVRNTGAIPAVNIPVTDRLPRGAEVVSTSEGAVANGRTIVWTIDELAPGAMVDFTVTVSFSKSGTYENIASLPTPDGPWLGTTGNKKCTDGDGNTDGVACAAVTVPPQSGGLPEDDENDPDDKTLADDGDLPQTGAGAAPGLLAAGLGLLGLGLGLIVVRRRQIRQIS